MNRLNSLSRKLVLHFIICSIYVLSILVARSIVSTLFQATFGLVITLYIVGDSLKSLLKKSFSLTPGTEMGEIALSVLLSFTYFFIISSILSLIFALTALNLVIAVLIPIIVVDLISVFQKWKNLQPISKPNFSYKQLTVLPVILTGISMAILFRSSFIWPSMPGWDLYPYLGGTNWIFANHGSYGLWPSSFGIVMPTSYVFQNLTASISYIAGTNPYALFWGAPFFTIPLFGVLVYGTSLSFTRNKFQAFFASIIVLVISGGETFLGPQYFFPSTLSIIVFLLILDFILGFDKINRLYFVLLVLFLTIFYSMYYFPIVVTLPLFVILLVRQKFLKSWPRNRVIFLSGSILLGMIALSWFGASSLSGSLGPWPYEKLSLLIDSPFFALTGTYPLILFLLFLSGSAIVLLQYLKRIPKVVSALLPIYALSLLVIFFLPPFSSAESKFSLGASLR